MSSTRFRVARKKTKEYLIKKGADSADKAIKISDNKWKEFGWISNPFSGKFSRSLQGAFSGMQSIKITEDDRVWYDQEAHRTSTKVGCIIFLVVAVLVILSIVAIGLVPILVFGLV
jgi:hypothetical protein